MRTMTGLPYFEHRIYSTPVYIVKILDDVYCFIIQADEMRWEIYQCYAQKGHTEPVDEVAMTTATLEDAIEYINNKYRDNEVVQDFVREYTNMRRKRCTARQIQVMGGIGTETQEDATAFFAKRVCYFAMKDVINKMQYNKLKIKK